MRFIEYEAEHLLWVMDVAGSVLNEQAGIDLMELARKSKTKGPCLTLVNEKNETIACGGLAMMFKGSAEIWVRLSKKAGPHAVKALREQMYRWIEGHRLVRLQATGPVAWEKLPPFLEWLGMQREGVLRKYGPHGEDYLMYSWVRP